MGEIGDFDDGFFVFEVLAFLLGVVGLDGFGIVVRNEARVAELIGEGFSSANEVIEILEFGADSFNAESNAIFAFCLCLWRWDQWLDRIVLRDGVR